MDSNQDCNYQAIQQWVAELRAAFEALDAHINERDKEIARQHQDTILKIDRIISSLRSLIKSRKAQSEKIEELSRHTNQLLERIASIEESGRSRRALIESLGHEVLKLLLTSLVVAIIAWTVSGFKNAILPENPQLPAKPGGWHGSH